MSKGDATRQAVIDQAVEIAGRLGVAGLTIGTLAAATGMSKSGLYAHFRSKEALQLAVLGSAREHFVDQVFRPALAAPRGEPRVRTLFERWLATSSTDSNNRWAIRSASAGLIRAASWLSRACRCWARELVGTTEL